MTISFEMDGPLAVLTFNAPPLNLLRPATFTALAQALDQAMAAKARAILTLASGEHFCAGADVKAYFVGKDGRDARELLAQSFAITQRLERLPIPTVVAVRGMCLGGGCELAQLHDIVWAGESAQFGQIEARIGTATLLAGGARLVARVGLARAKEMVLSANPFPASILLTWGMINRVLPDNELEEKARAYALKLANGPTVAHAVNKSLVNAAANQGLSAADELTIAHAPLTFDTADMRLAVARFAEGGAEALAKGLKFEGA